MNEAEPGEFRFVCPACGESLAVDLAMRDALLDNGCVVCGVEVSIQAFTARSADD